MVISLQKDLSDDVMLYAAAATGFKAGGLIYIW
jgi:outer membrane receptor protein involved in Fe transport